MKIAGIRVCECFSQLWSNVLDVKKTAAVTMVALAVYMNAKYNQMMHDVCESCAGEGQRPVKWILVKLDRLDRSVSIDSGEDNI